MSDKPNINDAIEIVKMLDKAGFEALLAGGCVRDLLMKQEAHDFDVATTANPDEIEKLFAKTVAVGKKFGVMLVVMDGNNYEVATFRKEGKYADGRHPDWVEFATPEEDAKRRDFTINGIFYDPVKKKVYDYVGGEEDIKKKCVRAIGDAAKRFAEDHLRLIRTVRFCANLGFSIEPQTWQALIKLAPEIKSVSIERVRDELIKMFTRPHAGEALKLLSTSGLLGIILPEIERMKGVEQPPEFHPEGDVFVHTALMMDLLENPSVELAMSTLFHDVAKPDTFDNTTDRIRFNNHAELGAKKTEEIMRRLRFPNKVIDPVCVAIQNHMKFKDVKNMRQGKLRNFIASETFPLELELHRLDCSGSHKQLDNYYFCKEQLATIKEEELRPKPIVNGHQLEEAGYKPGPKFKKWLEELYELQLEGKVKTVEDGLKHAKKHFK